ncbi:MAG: hypothetical protein JWO10_2140 [Microbacteriaceae bacterium]|nr:hypothetical protein [Microbacteriaceae bacterium]
MPDLKIEFDDLDLLKARLDAALLQFESDVSNTQELEAASGHLILAGAIDQFSTKWNKHRMDIRDNLDWMKDSVGKIGTSFTKTDDALANALEKPPVNKTAIPHAQTGGGNGRETV